MLSRASFRSKADMVDYVLRIQYFDVFFVFVVWRVLK